MRSNLKSYEAALWRAVLPTTTHLIRGMNAQVRGDKGEAAYGARGSATAACRWYIPEMLREARGDAYGAVPHSMRTELSTGGLLRRGWAEESSDARSEMPPRHSDCANRVSAPFRSRGAPVRRESSRAQRLVPARARHRGSLRLEGSTRADGA